MRRLEVDGRVAGPGLHLARGSGAAHSWKSRRRGGVERYAMASGRVIRAAGRPVAAPKPRYAAADSALELACGVSKTRRALETSARPLRTPNQLGSPPEGTRLGHAHSAHPTRSAAPSLDAASG